MTKPILLAISPDPSDGRSLQDLVEDCTVRQAGSCHEGLELIEQTGSTVVLCETQLPDGDWRDVLHEVETLEHPPPVIVTSRHADESLWAEVLNRGGFDVLLKPFEISEVARVLQMACRKALRHAAAS